MPICCTQMFLFQMTSSYHGREKSQPDYLMCKWSWISVTLMLLVQVYFISLFYLSVYFGCLLHFFTSF